MDRRKKMLRKRRKKQNLVDEKSPGHILIFGEGTAAVKSCWKPENKDGEKPLPYHEQS